MLIIIDTSKVLENLSDSRTGVVPLTATQMIAISRAISNSSVGLCVEEHHKPQEERCSDSTVPDSQA